MMSPPVPPYPDASPYTTHHTPLTAHRAHQVAMWCVLPTAASETNPNADFPMRWGRLDAADCAAESNKLPNAEKTLTHVLEWTSGMGLSTTEATALMGAHTLGRMEAQFSGYAGNWVRNVARLDGQAYYSEMINKPWNRQVDGMGTKHSWVEPRAGTVMLNTDMALAFDIGTEANVNSQTCSTGAGRNLCPRHASGDGGVSSALVTK